MINQGKFYYSFHFSKMVWFHQYTMYSASQSVWFIPTSQHGPSLCKASNYFYLSSNEGSDCKNSYLFSANKIKCSELPKTLFQFRANLLSHHSWQKEHSYWEALDENGVFSINHTFRTKYITHSHDTDPTNIHSTPIAASTENLTIRPN